MAPYGTLMECIQRESWYGSWCPHARSLTVPEPERRWFVHRALGPGPNPPPWPLPWDAPGRCVSAPDRCVTCLHSWSVYSASHGMVAVVPARPLTRSLTVLNDSFTGRLPALSPAPRPGPCPGTPLVGAFPPLGPQAFRFSNSPDVGRAVNSRRRLLPTVTGTSVPTRDEHFNETNCSFLPKL